MGADVSLVSMAVTEAGPHVPYVVDEIGGLGFGTLAGTLKSEAAAAELLIDAGVRIDGMLPCLEVPGLTRYYVLNPLELADSIEEAGDEGWRWDGLGDRASVIAALRTHPEHTWWFHVSW